MMEMFVNKAHSKSAVDKQDQITEKNRKHLFRTAYEITFKNYWRAK